MNHKDNFDWLLGGLFLALAIALPLAFHLVGMGSTFLPMFYPVVLAGFLLRLQVSVLVGILAPLLSAALTGMPPLYPPVAFIMVLELLVMTALPWMFFQRLRLNIYLSLFHNLLLLVLRCSRHQRVKVHLFFYSFSLFILNVFLVLNSSCFASFH